MPGLPALAPVLHGLRQVRGARAKAIVEGFLTKGLWPGDRLGAAGYMIQGSCQFCGKRDTLWHRVWECQHEAAQAIRKEVGGDELMLLAREAEGTPRQAFFECGWQQDPYDIKDHVTADVVVHRQHRFDGDDDWDDGGEPGCADEAEEFFHGGSPIFTDGSCSTSNWLHEVQAGWGICQRNRADNGWLRAFGPVWRPLLQSSPSSEWAAWAVAHVLGAQATSIRTDCQLVVSWTSKGSIGLMLNEKFAHAGYVKEAMATKPSGLITTTKVVGHAREKGLSETMENMDGNEMADAAADRGRECHPRPRAEQLRHAEELNQLTAKLLCMVGQLWQLWELPGRLVRSPPRARIARTHRVAPPGHPHRWAWAWGHWQCTTCCRICSAGASPASRAKGECTGEAKVIKQILSWPMGHQLRACSIAGQAIILCDACGAWSNMRTKLLDLPCRKSATRAGRVALKRVQEQGLHPLFYVQVPVEYTARLSVVATGL